MQGECRADISRNAFDEKNGLRRVVFQGGRVILESDLNHVVSILLHRLERSIEDIVGPHGGNGFEVTINTPENQVLIGKGRYYVHGIGCENPTSCLITGQPDYEFERIGSDGSYLLYLDVFEVHRAGRPEAELQGIDTVAEGKIVWQVKALPIQKKTKGAGDLKTLDAIAPEMEQRSETDQWALVKMARGNLPEDSKELSSFESTTLRIQPPSMRARTKPLEQAQEPCLIPPDSHYRGDRQLYRIEIHRSGYSKQSEKTPVATFKWSRENSSLIYPIIAAPKTQDGLTTVKVEHLGRDVKLGLRVGQWIELTDEQEYKHSIPGQLMQIRQIDRDQLRITLSGVWNGQSGGRPGVQGILRRWDHQGIEEGAIVINGEWQTLENGLEVQFKPDTVDQGRYYSRGMYWTFVASAMLGDIEWKSSTNASGELVRVFSQPHGIAHHYAPLAITEVSKGEHKSLFPLSKTIKVVAS
jgi:hypothetical protein